MRNVILADDDLGRAQALKSALAQDGLAVVVVSDGHLVVAAVRSHAADAVMLSDHIGDVDGLDLCSRISQARTAAVLVYSGLRDDAHELLCFASGADDYVRMPCAPAIVSAHVRALLRRGPPRNGQVPLRVLGQVDIDVALREVTVDGAPVALTRTEFDLLVALAENPARVVPRTELLERVWREWPEDSHVLDVHLSRLRRKIRVAGGPPIAHRVVGAGYRIAAATSARPSLRDPGSPR